VAAVAGDAAAIVRESGAGVVCDPGNPSALAEAILKIYGLPPGQRESFAQAGLAYYRAHFDRGKIIDRFEAILSEGSSALAR